MSHSAEPDLAHRLRTPLAVIVGYVEILAMRDKTGESTEVLDRLREASAELSAVIDDVIAADAASAGRRAPG
jgi:signal transduction histidine kinase